MELTLENLKELVVTYTEDVEITLICMVGYLIQLGIVYRCTIQTTNVTTIYLFTLLPLKNKKNPG